VARGAVRITRRIRAWLPVLLAMSASSPFFQGEDTGYASYRTVVVSRCPTVGPPPDFASAEEYDRTVATLIRSEVISNAGMIYFDARLSARYPTVEIRVADACPSVDDAVLIAALARALVMTAAHADTTDTTPGHWPDAVPESPQVLLRAATWRAARSGLDGHLIDPRTTRALPAAEVVQALLAHLRSALEEYGERPLVAQLSEAVLTRGPSARRQRAALSRGAAPWPPWSPNSQPRRRLAERGSAAPAERGGCFGQRLLGWERTGHATGGHAFERASVTLIGCTDLGYRPCDHSQEVWSRSVSLGRRPDSDVSGSGLGVLGEAVLPAERWPVVCEGVVAASEPDVGCLFDVFDGWRTDGGYRRSGQNAGQGLRRQDPCRVGGRAGFGAGRS
jgi:hypothetical protein